MERKHWREIVENATPGTYRALMAWLDALAKAKNDPAKIARLLVTAPVPLPSVIGHLAPWFALALLAGRCGR